jgi:hypothetical protein
LTIAEQHHADRDEENDKRENDNDPTDVGVDAAQNV